MKLTQVTFENFRCYKERTQVTISDLTCFIGKNDVGKSTVLEGLNIFFNESVDKGDLSVDASSETLEITCLFEDLPEMIVLDTSIETSLAEEFLLNKDGQLEIKKIFKFGKTITKSTFVVANHPDHEQLTNLLSLKNTPLKALADTLGANLEGVNKKKNPPLRRAIRNAIQHNLAVMEIKVDGSIDNESNIKTIWKNISAILPVFSLFKGDRNLDDKDKDVQDPMRQAIKESLAAPDIMQLLSQVEDAVRKSSTDIADRTLEKLKDIDKSLAEKMKSDFSKSPTWDKIFDLTLLNDRNIPLNKRGSGVRRLVLPGTGEAKEIREEEKVIENAKSNTNCNSDCNKCKHFSSEHSF